MRKLACLVLILLAAGCEPAPILRLTSRDPGATWFQGQQLVRHEADGVSVVASFDRSLGMYLVFDVTVVNRSDSTLLIEPQDFNFTLASSGGELRPAQQKPFPAVDPEAELARIDKVSSALESGHANGKMLEAVGDLAEAVVDVAGAGSKTKAEQDADEKRDLEQASERRQADETHERTMASLAESRDYWASRALRRTQLAPRQSISGKIALPAGPIPALLSRPTHANSITSFDDGAALAPGDILILTLHSPIRTNAEGMEFIVREL